MWLQLALLAGQMWLGEVTRQRPHKTSFEEFVGTNAPDELRPPAYGGGTFEVIPQRIWYGDFNARAVERDSHWTDYIWAGALAGLLDVITVAYRYYCGEVFALCYGPDTHVERVTIADRLMYQAAVGSDNAGGSFLIDDPQAWGGDQPPGEGGQYSLCDITRGNYSDAANAYLASVIGASVPALWGVSLLISRGFSGFTESGYFAAGGVGYTPRFKEWKVVCRRQPSNLGIPEFSKVGRHANPMEVYYEHCTSLEYGAKLPVSEINIPSFRSAAETLHGENLGWSGKIESATSPEQVRKNIEAQIDAQSEPSPSLGLTIRLIRHTYSIPALPILNQNNVVRVDRYAPGTYEDTINKVIIPFEDQDNNFKPRPGIYIDPANQIIQGGRTVPITQNYIGVGDYETANLLATRDGRALSIPRPPLECEVLPSVGRVRYLGEVVKFQWSQPTFSKVMRVTSITKGTTRDPNYRLELIEDQFATGIRTFGEPVGTGHDDPAAGLSTPPPSASWNEADFPPDGLRVEIVETNTGQFQAMITGGIIFGTYAPGGQFARIWVTEPGGTQTLSPLHLAPGSNNEATFTWPAIAEGTYEFCVQTLSIKQATNGVKVCAEIDSGAITGEPGSGNFNLPQIQFSGTGSISVGGGGGFNIP